MTHVNNIATNITTPHHTTIHHTPTALHPSLAARSPFFVKDHSIDPTELSAHSPFPYPSSWLPTYAEPAMPPRLAWLDMRRTLALCAALRGLRSVQTFAEYFSESLRVRPRPPPRKDVLGELVDWPRLKFCGPQRLLIGISRQRWNLQTVDNAIVYARRSFGIINSRRFEVVGRAKWREVENHLINAVSSLMHIESRGATRITPAAVSVDERTVRAFPPPTGTIDLDEALSSRYVVQAALCIVQPVWDTSRTCPLAFCGTAPRDTLHIIKRWSPHVRCGYGRG